LHKLHDSKQSCERKEMYMRFYFLSRKVVQANLHTQSIFLEYILSKPNFLAKDSFCAESIDGSL